MKKTINDIVFLTPGTKLYRPTEQYDPCKDSDKYLVTEIVEAYEEDGEIFVVDNEGNLFTSKQFCKDVFFNTYSLMMNWYYR